MRKFYEWDDKIVEFISIISHTLALHLCMVWQILGTLTIWFHCPDKNPNRAQIHGITYLLAVRWPLGVSGLHKGRRSMWMLPALYFIKLFWDEPENDGKIAVLLSCHVLFLLQLHIERGRLWLLSTKGSPDSRGLLLSVCSEGVGSWSTHRRQPFPMACPSVPTASPSSYTTEKGPKWLSQSVLGRIKKKKKKSKFFFFFWKVQGSQSGQSSSLILCNLWRSFSFCL